VPTYVIGFSSPEDKARLKKIATDTGGTTTSKTRANCRRSSTTSAPASPARPRRVSSPMNSPRARANPHHHGRPKTHALRVTLTWANPGDNFKLTGLRIKSHGRLVAAARPQKTPKSKKLKVTVSGKSSTFAVLKVTHLRPGTLQFVVTAAKASGAVKVTTQVGGETG
jgi:hypothetical protein